MPSNPETPTPRKPRAKKHTRRFFSKIGTLGGSATSRKKKKSSAANGRLGGRPRHPIDRDHFTVSRRVWAIVGLDDLARYPDVTRTVAGARVACEGTRAALVDLLTEINDRATEGADGFNESGSAKASCRAAVRRLRAKGWEPRS